MVMRRQQLGMSSLGFFCVVLFVAAFIKVAAVTSTPYFDFYNTDKAIDSLFRDGHPKSIDDFKRSLSNRFAVNNIRDKTPEDFAYSYEDKKLVVTVDYEIRKPFIANIDVVMHFKKTYGGEAKPDDK